jgi:hypothetical protein
VCVCVCVCIIFFIYTGAVGRYVIVVSEHAEPLAVAIQVRSLLALLVQKYKY